MFLYRIGLIQVTRKNDKKDGRFDRRSFLKTVGVSSTVGAGVFASTSSGRSLEGVAIDPEEDTRPHPDLDYHKPHHSIQELSPYWTLLVLDENAIIDYIDDSDFSAKRKREARVTLQDLRSRFPIVEERDTEKENRIWWKLAPGADSKAKKDPERFMSVARVHADGMQRNELQTQWYYNSHRKQTKTAAKEVGVSSPSDISEWADDPDHTEHYDVSFDDNWDHDTDLEEAFEYGINKIHRHYSQYLDVDAAKSFTCYHNNHNKDYAVGTADHEGEWHLDQAKNASTQSEEDEYLGKATHFPEDMSNPLHTGMGWQQLTVDLHYDSDEDDDVGWEVSTKKWLHYEFEEFLSDQWSSGWDFQYHFESNDCDGCYYYYSIDDASSALWDMANESGNYSQEVYKKIHDEGDVDWTDWSWSTESDMADICDNMMDMCGKYVRGYFKEFY